MLCGRKEECFEPGPQWGHFEGVLCKFTKDRGAKHSFVCVKTSKTIHPDNVYTTEDQRAELNS